MKTVPKSLYAINAKDGIGWDVKIVLKMGQPGMAKRSPVPSVLLCSIQNSRKTSVRRPRQLVG